MTRPRILLADDHTVVVEGLRRILEGDFEVVGSVSDGLAMLKAVDELRPDVVVVDITMPVMNGVAAVRQLRKKHPKAKVIFLTMHPEVTYAAEALNAGGLGYVVKVSAGEDLVTAIREVLQGRVYVTPLVDPEALRAVLTKRGQRDDAAVLTTRQREVLQLVAEGRSIKEIGKLLHVSNRTVEFHKYGMMKKLGLRTTAELVQYAMRERVV